MKIRAVIFFLSILFSCSSLLAQEKYQGIMVTKLGGKQSGTITVNLNGSNNELIEISTEEKTRSKKRGKKTDQTLSTSMKLNVALIHHIIINDTTYYFRDIKYDYNEKFHMNSCVRLVEGTLDCGMFQIGRSDEPTTIGIKLPNEEFSKLIAVDFDYYRSTTGWHIMGFGKCSSLRSKMSNKETGYTWDDNNNLTQRISMWKTWIKEFNACKKD
jgi:hypothetical protein